MSHYQFPRLSFASPVSRKACQQPVTHSSKLTPLLIVFRIHLLSVWCWMETHWGRHCEAQRKTGWGEALNSVACHSLCLYEAISSRLCCLQFFLPSLPPYLSLIRIPTAENFGKYEVGFEKWRSGAIPTHEWELKAIAVKLQPVHLCGEGDKDTMGLEGTVIRLL